MELSAAEVKRWREWAQHICKDPAEIYNGEIWQLVEWLLQLESQLEEREADEE